ncbi:MAG: efflux RND transporter permease subunit, partial [Verrucomicrobiae bacterium]|nr:efflux RND transporter permease subunit [Verrucomicrobiae bacterium]
MAYTKTFALIASIIIALTLIPPLAHVLLASRTGARKGGSWWRAGLVLTVILAAAWIPWFPWWAAGIVVGVAGFHEWRHRFPEGWNRRIISGFNYVVAIAFVFLLADHWLPLGPEKGWLNHLFVGGIIGGLLLGFIGFIHVYGGALDWCLGHKRIVVTVIGSILLLGAFIWLGVGRVLWFVPDRARDNAVWSAVMNTFPGLGQEFMPPLDEGAFLFMPSLMPHASIGESMNVLGTQDRAIRAIPEVESVVGKIGRADSSLDPAPIAMVETIINYKSEYLSDDQGRRLTYQYDRNKADFVRDETGNLIPDAKGRPFRQWRDEIRTPDDIWQEILKVTELPGVTSAPKLQPIETRLIMLQTGMRAPMGLKVRGPDLETIEKVGLEIEQILREVPAVEPASVFADRIVGKPYLEIDIDRQAIARYGMTIQSVQHVIEVAIGGRKITTTVEGRERYAVRVRYQRELRDTIESLGGILIPAADMNQVPLRQLAEIRYVRGPQMIKSEDTFLTGYVIFDKKPGYAEVDVVRQAEMLLESKREAGEFVVPAGVSYRFTGSYENQLRATEKLRLLVPLSLFLIFIVIYLQFRSVTTTFLVFSGIFVAWSGGFILIWLYGQGWFLDATIAGVDLRELFQIRPINLSVAVWVGFLALFGIATDDGVLMATYLKQRFAEVKPTTVKAIRLTAHEAAMKRVRPAMMTTATTVLALLPVLTSTGRGSDVMLP